MFSVMINVCLLYKILHGVALCTSETILSIAHSDKIMNRFMRHCSTKLLYQLQQQTSGEFSLQVLDCNEFKSTVK